RKCTVLIDSLFCLHKRLFHQIRSPPLYQLGAVRYLAVALSMLLRWATEQNTKRLSFLRTIKSLLLVLIFFYSLILMYGVVIKLVTKVRYKCSGGLEVSHFRPGGMFVGF